MIGLTWGDDDRLPGFQASGSPRAPCLLLCPAWKEPKGPGSGELSAFLSYNPGQVRALGTQMWIRTALASGSVWSHVTIILNYVLCSRKRVWELG